MRGNRPQRSLLALFVTRALNKETNLDYITINVNKKFLIVVTVIATSLSGSYYWGKYQYSKGVEDAVEYVMKTLGAETPSSNMPKRGL